MPVPGSISEEAAGEDKRYTVLTTKAQQQYESRKDELDSKLDIAWSKTRTSICDLNASSDSVEQIKAAQQTLRQESETFTKCADELFNLLIRANTMFSLSEYRVLAELFKERSKDVSEAIKEASGRIAAFNEAKSSRSGSRSSRYTSRSSHSSVLTAAVKARAEAAAMAAEASVSKMKAEVESAKAHMREKDQLAAAEVERLKAQVEADEKIRLAASVRRATELDSQLELLRLEERTLAANARAETLEQAALEHDSIGDTLQRVTRFDRLPTTAPDQLVKDYITHHSQSIDSERNDETSLGKYADNTLQQNQCDSAPVKREQPDTLQYASEHGKFSQRLANPYTRQQGNQQETRDLSTQAFENQRVIQQGQAPSQSHTFGGMTRPQSHMVEPNYNTGVSFATQHQQTTLLNSSVHPTNASISEPESERSVRGWFEYFAHKDLVVQGLTQFDDNPANYRGWKLSFQNSISDARITPAEELNLLVKWTGPKSTDIVKKIRSVNIHNPTTGLTEAWGRLEEYYGRPEVVTNSLLKMIKDFPKIHQHDNQRLREFSDLLYMLKAAKDDLPGLSYLDTYLGVNELVQKLPYGLPGKWRSRGKEYKERYNVSFPPFEYFASFVRKMADERNDPSFDFSTFEGGSYASSVKKPQGRQSTNPKVVARKTDVDNSRRTNDSKNCPIHKMPHSLDQCRGFKAKPLDERLKLLRDLGLCFKCVSTGHRARECTVKVNCSECGSDRHPSALHVDSKKPDVEHTRRKEIGRESKSPETRPKEIGGESKTSGNVPTDASTFCTEVCGDSFSSKSCAKICLVKIYPSGKPDLAENVYVILDDQSNRSLAKTEFFNLLGLEGNSSPYTLRTCSGRTHTMGRRAKDLVVESLDGKIIPLPTIIECNEIPDSRAEIPTPVAARHFAHLRPIADLIPSIDERAQILVLLGRDILQAHKVREQRNGPGNAPFAQRLDLGWVIVGDVCLDGAHKPDNVDAYKTFVHDNGRTSLLQPCPNKFVIQESGDEEVKGTEQPSTMSSVQCNKVSVDNSVPETDKGLPIQERKERFIGDKFEDGLGQSVFNLTKHDSKLGLSIEDRKFLNLMTREMYKDSSNSWTAPLPFKEPRPMLPNNWGVASRRLATLLRSLSENTNKKKHYFTFMEDLFHKGHAEIAPALDEGEECWFLAHFGVYHPRKLDKIRVVFDSSCQSKGISLNSVLLSGPDLMNSLLGVLIRFRHGPVAFVADIQQMFHSFFVREDHRNFLRFLWYKDNNPDLEIAEYRMKVHLFGNSPSPAVANFGLLKTAAEGECEFGSDAREFVERNFYVDDGLKSTATPSEAIDLLRRTQLMLANANLRLHKIASNSAEVMAAFTTEDHAGELQNLDFNHDTLPMQRSLGVCWDIQMDSFTFKVSTEEKPYTRRGLLSVINILYDPLGFVAPVTIEGKHFLRTVMTSENTKSIEWDDPLPTDKQTEWNRWNGSLQKLSDLSIPRSYVPTSFGTASRKELHIFGDASDVAIAASAYLRLIDNEGACQVSFVIGKSKLAPNHATTTPRLELCAAVLAVELYELAEEEIDLKVDSVSFYSDSRVTLGYIRNETRRFYVYVNNRVQRIRHSTEPKQWSYVPTDINPADHATRAVAAADLRSTTWLTGPEFLRKNLQLPTDWISKDPSNSEGDPEVRPQVSTLRTEVSNDGFLRTERYNRFSKWQSLVRAIGNLVHIVRNYSPRLKGNETTCYGWHRCRTSPSVDELAQAKNTIIQSVQWESFRQEINCLRRGQSLSTHSSIRSLNPFIDANGLLRVGGRLNRSDLPADERNPLIIPSKCHLATLLIRHQHENVRHQGRHFTHGAVRSSGLWIIGGKRLVNKVISDCVKCHKLRGRQETQQMSDLPIERLSAEPPFTYVGLDVFGPWSVVARRTRGGHAKSKRWAILFTCMAVRAVHIEVIDEMDASTTINALRRFFAIRGPAKQLRSDNGTNFVGACNELCQLMSGECVREFLIGEGCSWEFNPPHSSHMGGVWERMIGVVRRVLDSMFLDLGPTQLTYDVLTTLMAEVSAIVNARPLVPVSSDPEAPEILTPSSLLTQKFGVPASPPPGLFSKKDIYGRQWRRVQYLANVFWTRWRREYLPTLQPRRKWQDAKDNINPGDLVLVKDKQLPRNEWPVGRVLAVMPSDDSKVRKVSVNIARNNTVKTFRRPVSELILLMRDDQS